MTSMRPPDVVADPVAARRSLEWRRMLITVLAVMAIAVGCGDDGATSTDATTTSTTVVSTTTDTTPDDITTTDPEPVTTTTVGEETTTTATEQTTTLPPPTEPLPAADLPGTAFDLTPPPGAVLSVIGVRHDDVLNVRRAPGTDQEIVARLDNLADDFVASGRARMLTRSIWWEVTTTDGIIGWVSARFTARTGPTLDHTAEVVELIGSVPAAETMLDLGLVVANSVNFAAHTDPEVPLAIVLVVPPSVGDLGEVTYDARGLADDTTMARRLHVFGQPLESGEGFSLMSVEATEMCDPVRGVSPPGEPCS